MKRIETHKKAKTKKTAVSTTLIIVSVVLLLVGIVLLLIDPIKRANRRRISSDALNEIEKKIVSTDPSEEPVATTVIWMLSSRFSSIETPQMIVASG